MNIQNLPTLKIHKLTQEQYDREYAAGNLDPNALYLTPDEGADLPFFVQEEEPVDAEDGTIWVDTNEETLNLSGLLPEVDADDNGKTIKVINGYWQLTDAASGIDQTARDAAAAAQTTANAAMPKAGGQFTGDISFANGKGLNLGGSATGAVINMDNSGVPVVSWTDENEVSHTWNLKDILDGSMYGKNNSGVMDEINNRKIKTYYSLSHLGLSGAVTTDQVFSAMPEHSKFIFVNNKNNTNHISDIPDKYTIVELNKSSAQGKGSYVNYSSTSLSSLIVKECSWYNGATFAGWFPIMTAAGGQFTGDVSFANNKGLYFGDSTNGAVISMNASGLPVVSWTDNAGSAHTWYLRDILDGSMYGKNNANAMLKSGGTFTGNVVAYSTNRSGASVRNITVQNSSGTNQSTNQIIMKRK